MRSHRVIPYRHNGGVPISLATRLVATEKRRDRAFVMALIGDVGNTLLSSVRDAAARDVDAAQQNRAGDCRTLAGKHFRQVLLTIPVDAGNTQHFSGPKIEADVMHGTFARLRCRCHPAEPEQRRRAPINSAWVAPGRLVFQRKASDTARLPILAEHEADNLVDYLLLRHGRELNLVDAADEST